MSEQPKQYRRYVVDVEYDAIAETGWITEPKDGCSDDRPEEDDIKTLLESYYGEDTVRISKPVTIISKKPECETCDMCQCDLRETPNECYKDALKESQPTTENK